MIHLVKCNINASYDRVRSTDLAHGWKILSIKMLDVSSRGKLQKDFTRNIINNINKRKHLFIVFYNEPYNALVTSLIKPYHIVSFQQELSPVIRTASHQFDDIIPIECIEEVKLVSTWYTPIESVIYVRYDTKLFDAWGIIQGRTPSGGKIYHLVVVGDAPDDVVGVVKYEHLQQAVEGQTVERNRFGGADQTIRPIIITREKILRFDSQYSKDQVKTEIKKHENRGMFYYAGCVLITDQSRQVIGFASLYDLID